jgi:hypothetical protein
MFRPKVKVNFYIIHVPFFHFPTAKIIRTSAKLLKKEEKTHNLRIKTKKAVLYSPFIFHFSRCMGCL